jgi:protein-S-isoprenylcysteine O-methyltransferase Ste14
VGILELIALLHSSWRFAVHGKGTLAPIDPPKLLVIQGLYRHIRNPMYLSIIIVFLSEATCFRGLTLVIYAAAALLGFHLFVVFYKEPRLQSRFGEDYQRYFREIPRWWITWRGFKINQQSTVT